MANSDVLDALLGVSTDEKLIACIPDELNQYYDILIGVIVESTQSFSSQMLESDRLYLKALKCLINFSSDELQARKMFSTTTVDRRAKFLESLVKVSFSDAYNEAKYLTNSLLINLTQVKEWLDEVSDDTLMKKICSKPFLNPKSTATDLQLLLNLTNCCTMRRHICTNISLLNTLSHILNETDNPEMRIAVAGIIKNCSFEDGNHANLCFEADNLFSKILQPLCGSEDCFDEDECGKLAPTLRDIYAKGCLRRESDNQIKKTLCESLLQVCSSSNGRSHLRSLGAYFILRELHRHECAKEKALQSAVEDGCGSGRALQMQRSLIFLIEQIVDQLICEEYERPIEFRSKNLRDVQVGYESSEILDAAKAAFLES